MALLHRVGTDAATGCFYSGDCGPVAFNAHCNRRLKSYIKMDQCEDEVDEDEAEWESSFLDSDPFEPAAASGAAAGS